MMSVVPVRCCWETNAGFLEQTDHEIGRETPEFPLSKIDDFGTPGAYNHYAVGWAYALCAPYRWTKQVASHWGGTRNGAVVHWPDGSPFDGCSGPTALGVLVQDLDVPPQRHRDEIRDQRNGRSRAGPLPAEVG